jgi:hypothetical protein
MLAVEWWEGLVLSAATPWQCLVRDGALQE